MNTKTKKILNKHRKQLRQLGSFKVIKMIIVKKLNSLKHLVRTTVAESHNKNSKYQKGAIT